MPAKKSNRAAILPKSPNERVTEETQTEHQKY